MARIPKCLGFPTRVAGFPSLIRKEPTASRRKVRAPCAPMNTRDEELGPKSAVFQRMIVQLQWDRCFVMSFRKIVMQNSIIIGCNRGRNWESK
jgi:hypothetical protein